MYLKHSLPAAALLLAGAAVATVGLSGCSAVSSLNGDHHWATSADLRSSAEAETVPTLVATDATDIDLHTAQLSKSGTQLRWKSTSGITRTDCKPDAIGTNTTPDASWWPDTTPKQGWSCGWWRVFTHDGAYYAWHNTDTSIGT